MCLSLPASPQNRINFPAAVPVPARLGSQLGQALGRVTSSPGPLRPKGRSRDADRLSRVLELPAPAWQTKEWRGCCSCPESVPRGHRGGGRPTLPHFSPPVRRDPYCASRLTAAEGNGRCVRKAMAAPTAPSLQALRRAGAAANTVCSGVAATTAGAGPGADLPPRIPAILLRSLPARARCRAATTWQQKRES